MAGCRPLTLAEERAVIRVARRLAPRDRALVIAQLLTGFRISELLSLTLGAVFKNGRIVAKIGIAPRHMKGGYGTTRWIPVLPELECALQSLISSFQKRYVLCPDLPLFLSRQDNVDGNARAITRETARVVIQATFAKAGIVNDGRLGTHALRKTFARNIYRNSGKDLMVLKKALNHSSVVVTQRYLEVVEDDVVQAVRRCDRSRSRKTAVSVLSLSTPSADGASLALPLPTGESSSKENRPPNPPAGQLDFLAELTAA